MFRRKYKDVYLDIYQLIEIIASLPQVDEKRLSSYGASQGGALALVAAALNPRIQKTVIIYPFLSDFRRVLEIGNTSEAYDELFRYFKFHDPFHETEEEIMATLAYIDVKNLAHRIKGKVKMITGLDDDVCYPITQFAIYNRLTCDKAYRIMPEYAHEAMNVFVNDQVYNWLCGSQIPFKYVKWWMRESSSSLFVQSLVSKYSSSCILWNSYSSKISSNHVSFICNLKTVSWVACG